MRRRALGPLAALSLVVWACGDGDQVGPPPPAPPPPAEPGPVDFDITTSADVDDGALLLTVLGGPVDSVRGLAGYDVLDAPTATGARAIVYGAIVDGALLRVWVPNASVAARYSVRVDEGARRATYQVVPGASYTVSRRP